MYAKCGVENFSCYLLVSWSFSVNYEIQIVIFNTVRIFLSFLSQHEMPNIEY